MTAGASVLVVDDDPVIRSMLTASLQASGHRVTTADSGSRALDLVRAEGFDVVLLDVLMPQIDGYTVCERLRADRRGAAIPVILLTANFITADQEVARQAGADDFVVKPFDPYELMARVKALMPGRP